jgi:hypothetical protein
MTAEEWIAAFAAEIGMDAPDEEAKTKLLDLAATAAHSSERIAAPLACYLTGLSGKSLAEASEAAERVGEASDA